MTLEQKLLIISRAVQKHGIRKLARRIIVADHDIAELNVNKIDDIVQSIQRLERNWKRLRKHIREHGIHGISGLLEPDFRFKLRYLNYYGMEYVLDRLNEFEVERFYYMERLDAAIPTA